MGDHKYSLKYKLKFEAGSFAKGEAGKDGLTDALLVGSMVFPKDGSLSVVFVSADGRNRGKPMDAITLFKAWIMLGEQVEARGLGGWQGDVVKSTNSAVRYFVTGKGVRGTPS